MEELDPISAATEYNGLENYGQPYLGYGGPHGLHSFAPPCH